MDFKAELNGNYSAIFFTAQDLPMIVNMVKLNEQTREEEAKKAKEAAEKAGEELIKML